MPATLARTDGADASVAGAAPLAGMPGLNVGARSFSLPVPNYGLIDLHHEDGIRMRIPRREMSNYELSQLGQGVKIAITCI